jgi:tRNA G18 (ribose-2'-O)-methylase SpoU
VPRLRRLGQGGADIVEVGDPDDPRLADYRALRDADLPGAFIAEGALVVRSLLSSSYRVRSVLVTPRKLAALADVLPSDVPVYVASRPLLKSVVGFDLHRGAVAAADRPSPAADAATVVRGARALLVVEDVSDAENMGSLFRNAAAFGVDGVLLSPRCCDPLYRRTVRVSMGHVLHVPFARVDAWPAAIDDVVRAAGFTVVALTPAADAADVAGVRVTRPAVLVGAEGPGLTDVALARADTRVRIPMRAGVDSVNVATAAAIALHRLVHAR